MQLNLKQLKNLPVYTQSNDCLGKIEEVEINSQTQGISNYIIKSSQLTKRLSDKKLIISSSQVVSIDNQKMIVEDGIIKETEKGLVNSPIGV